MAHGTITIKARRDGAPRSRYDGGMIRELLLWLVTLLVIEPIQAEWTARLEAAGAPRAVIEGLASCATAAGPALATRASEDPWWGVTTVAGVALGWRDGLTVVVEAVPTCAGPIGAARGAAIGRAA